MEEVSGELSVMSCTRSRKRERRPPDFSVRSKRQWELLKGKGYAGQSLTVQNEKFTPHYLPLHFLIDSN